MKISVGIFNSGKKFKKTQIYIKKLKICYANCIKYMTKSTTS